MKRIHRGKLVLVVEDHHDTQTCVAEELTEHGFEVLTASDGESAMRLIRERRPALVYLDICPTSRATRCANRFAPIHRCKIFQS
jgi:DNA-binding NtrC family response regulator